MKTKKLMAAFVILTIGTALFFWACQGIDTDSVTTDSTVANRATICSPSTVIAVPFTKDGTGEFCWETTTLCTYINSWNLDVLEVNGTAYTNTYVFGSSIAKVNNKYVIHYKSSVSWGHFEIAGTCTGGGATTAPTTAPTSAPTGGASRTATRTATTGVATRTATAASRTATRTATTPSGGTTVTSISALTSAISAAGSGAVITISGTLSTSSSISISKSGITIQGGAINFSGCSSYGINMSGSNNKLSGIKLYNCGDTVVYITGNNNTVDNCEMYNNADTALLIRKGGGGNKINNCNAHDNYDTATNGENADGFGCKWEGGSGNIFTGCIATHNSDDGWDLWMYTSPVTINNCTANTNGQGSAGDGNGFKLGGDGVSANHVLNNCSANNNKAWGYNKNNNPGAIQYNNCTGSGNGSGLIRP